MDIGGVWNAICKGGIDMLSKEECLEALRDIEFNLPMSYINSEYGLFGRCAYVNQIEILKNLIYEHFNNPPLKFEELEEDMWVWDNKRKVKLLIAYCYSEDDIGYYNFSNPEDYKYIHIEFEENRFYRKEVQE